MNQLQRPLVAALLALLAGLLLALRFAPPPRPFFGFALALLGWIIATRPADARAAILLLFALVGLASGAVTRQDVDGDCRTRLRDGQSIEARGLLVAAHREGAAGAGAPLLPLLSRTGQGSHSCGGEIRVRMPPGAEHIAAGAQLAVAGQWRLFSNTDSPSPWPRDPRFHGFLLVDSVMLEAEVSGGRLLRTRGTLDQPLAELFPRHHPLVEALLLGRREYVDRAVIDRFAAAGLSHLLAISGSHVALFAAVVFLLGTMARMRRRSIVLGTVATVWIYLGLIGAPSSAVRSGVMITVGLLGALLQRPAAAGAGVAAAALFILSLQPMAILEPGFQLSFLGVMGILGLRRPLLNVVPSRIRRQTVVRPLLDAFVIGVAAFAATAPVVAHHFGVVAPVSMLAGVPAVPLTSLALVGTLAALALHPVVQPVAALLADGTVLVLELIDRIATVAAATPFGHAAVVPPPILLWLSAGCAFLAVWGSRLFRRQAVRSAAASGAALAAFLLWPLGPRSGSAFAVHFIDVGQGDAVAIRTPENRWLLIDAGPASDGYDAGERRVLPFLRRFGVRQLEALILTHPDLDHIGGAAAVLEGVGVGFVFEPGLPVGREPYLELLSSLESSGTPWRAARAGRLLEIDGVRIYFLWPDPEALLSVADANEISAVMLVSYGDFSLLLTGDAGVRVEEHLVARHGAELDIDLLKLGHHGSSTSTSGMLLDAATPELAIVSAGRRNRYGHPAPDVVARVADRGIPMARTDLEGTLSVEVEEGGSEWRLREW